MTKEQAIAEAARQSATDGYSRYCHDYRDAPPRGWQVLFKRLARHDLRVLPPDLRGMPVDRRDPTIVNPESRT